MDALQDIDLLYLSMEVLMYCMNLLYDLDTLYLSM